ncbi:hypothetical protein TRFO_04699 [Tritrichomonas foetus]|uniref:Beige/BEACH domain containing protein n=1 Tax=Tritrichomonas foetus TaxID=1144522 RepID=A0A1J4KD04_9EUKA|nr:hypothetical protein TRFO_04699 [Tritrichomonas foetus]|eukprot:OHT09099.1 hypothetical protein TRFO_04699 [Tritrichomonas foetus]
MNQISLLSPKDLLVAIFSLKPPQVNSLLKIPHVIYRAILEIIQQLNQQSFDIKTIKKALEETDNIAYALQQVNFSFRYSYSFELIQMLAVIQYQDNESKFSAGYVSLFVYNLCYLEHNFSDVLLPYIFQSLGNFVDAPGLRVLLLSAFFNLYSEYAKSDVVESFDQIRPLVYDFFSRNRDLPASSYYVLVRTCQNLVDQKCTVITQPEIEFFTFIDMCARERETIFPSDVLEACIECITLRLNALDLFSLTFFSHFTDRISSKFCSTYFEVFPFSIYHFLTKEKPLNKMNFIKSPSIDSLNTKSNSEFLYGFNKSMDFKEKIDFETSILFPEHKPLSMFIKKDIEGRINLIIKAADPKPKLIKVFIGTFTNVLIEMTDSPYIFDLLAIFLEILGYYLPVYDLQQVFDMLNKSPIFDIRVNVFSESEDYELISSLRSFAFDFFYRTGLLSNFVEANVNRPYLLAEHLHRIVQSNMVLNDDQRVKLVRSILNAELTYQRLTHSDKGVQIARASIFVLLSRLLADTKFSVEFFKEDWFVAIFILSFLFENSLRSFVLSCIRNNLLADDSKNPKVVQNIINAINIAIEAIPSKNALEIIYDTITMLNEVANNKPSILDLLSAVRESIANTLAVLALKINDEVLDVAKDILIQSILFFTATSPGQRTTAAFISAFESAATSFHGRDFPSQMFGRIVQLISGSVTPSLQPNFIIREPKFTRFFLKLFRQTNQFVDVMIFLQKLCNFARENCEACHKGKVDSYLVEVLIFYKETYDYEKDHEIVDHCLSLLTSIVTVVSSVSFVHQCISLFTPISNQFISKLQPQFINTIAQIINKTGHSPSASFPLLSNGVKCLITLEAAQLNDGFSFLFWIYLENPAAQYMPTILELCDSANQKISIYLNMTRLILEVIKKRTKSVGLCEKNIPTNSWTFMSVHFYPSKIEDRAVICFNGKPLHDIAYPHTEFQHGTVKICVGGTRENSIDSPHPALFASFGVFQKLEETQIGAIYELGPKLKEPTIPALAMIKTVNLNNELKLELISGDSKFTYIKSEKQTKQNPNFTDVLLSSVKIENLIPLFAQLDLLYIDGTPYSQCIELSLQVFGSALTSSINAQRSLCESNGIDIIAHLFTVADPSHITYKLYMKIFNLYQVCSYPPLHSQMFSSLLFNFDLIMRASPENHLMILKHWSRSLFPAVLSSSSSTIITFTHIINALATFYWEVEPQHIYKPKEERSTFDVIRCRKCIIDIAFQVAQHRFDDDDLSSFISHIVNCRDEKMIECLLNLLRSLANNEKSPLKNATESRKNLSLILYLMNFKDEAIMANTIDTMIIMIKNKIITKMTLPELADIVIHQMSIEDASEVLLQRIIALMMNGTYELLSICFFIAVTIGEDRLLQLISSIHPSPAYFCHISWSMWPIIICYKVQNTELQNEILNFLLKCGDEQWANIIVMIDFIGRILSRPSEDMKANTLILLCEHVCKSPNLDHKKCIDLVTRFLFFRPENHQEKSIIDDLFRLTSLSVTQKKKTISISNSQLSLNSMQGAIISQEASLLFQQNQNHKVSIKPHEIYEIIQKYNFKPTEYHFGIRRNNYGDWIDTELAEICIRVFMKAPDEVNKYDSIMIMAAFLVRQKPEMITFIKSLINMISYVNDSPFTAYLNYAAKMSNLPPFFFTDYPIDNCATALDTLRQVRLNEIFNTEKQMPIYLKSFFATNWNKSLAIFSLIDDTIVTMTSNVTQSFFEENEQKKKENAKKWGRLWRSLSFDRAPWNIENQTSLTHFKRDFSSCRFSIPVKLKKNWHFDDHKKASMARDSEKYANDEHSEQNTANNSVNISRNSSNVFNSKQNLWNDDFENNSNKKDETSKTLKHSLKNKFECELISILNVIKGNMLIYSKFIKFSSKENTKTILFDDIREVYLRNRIHLPTAIEIFLINGKSYFFNFTQKNGLYVINKLNKFTMPRLQKIQLTDMNYYFHSNNKTDLWIDREISNFEYLMHLNQMSGRSFNDLSQYPVFPWVIKDFTSEFLDLTDPNVYRDLSKPCGALNPTKFSAIKERSVQMAEADDGNFLYTSGFIYPLIIIDFFVRIEPFTSLHIELQHGKFETPQRIFQSIPKTWQHIMNTINDNRELIPEFYSSPDFLINREKYDLGELKNNNRVNDVILPPWASSPFDFVYKMRKALESEYVSYHLNEWIDLIWGEKQRSPGNLFRPEMYADIWSSATYKINRDALEASLLNVGQIPPQLFNSPHPMRLRSLILYKDHQMYCHQTETRTFLVAFYTLIDNKISFVVITPDNKLVVYTISHKSAKRVNTRKSLSDMKSRFAQSFDVPAYWQKELKKGQIPSISHQKVIFTLLKPSTLIASSYGSSEVSLINIQTGNFTVLETPLNETSAIDAGKDYFVIACRNAVVNVYKTGTQPKQIASIASYRSRLPCVSISEKFNLIVNGTNDGFLIISSLTSCTVENVIDLNGGRPCNITISPSWGFIIVYYTVIEAGIVSKFIAVYNVNGQFLKKVKIEISLINIFSFSSPSAFDYIVLADSEGRLYMSDAYELEFGESFFRCHSKLATIDYCHKESCFVAFTAEGSILLISHEFT